MWLMTFKWEVN